MHMAYTKQYLTDKNRHGWCEEMVREKERNREKKEESEREGKKQGERGGVRERRGEENIKWEGFANQPVHSHGFIWRAIRMFYD